MLHAGLDLSRKRLDFHLLDEAGETVDVGAAPPDADGLRGLAARVGRHRQPLRAAIESMTGAPGSPCPSRGLPTSPPACA
jgi:transposase